MRGGDDMTDDPVIADKRNFYKVGLWTRDDRIERMLFAGTSLERARAIFADYARLAGSAADCLAAVASARPMAEVDWSLPVFGDSAGQ
jgi:hypothetical protein